MATVSELYQKLQPDPLRIGFSDDIEAVHRIVFQPGVDTNAIEKSINDWLGDHQPCLFGKIAARQGLIRYCILTEQLLKGPDSDIQAAIQRARLEWHAAGYEGKASGFVIVAVSSDLAFARPSPALAGLSQKLCEHYLLQQVPFDTVCTDTIYLEKPGHARRTWRWLVGANFFGSQGDKRWWHDHRIPGGIAFSMNSVGHMAKAGAINKAMLALDRELDETTEDWASSHVESLDKALVLAMRTIRKASEGPQPGTRLYHNTEREPRLNCPVKLPPDLDGGNHCDYFGSYHTDHTLPSDYFTDAVDPPQGAHSFDTLDFTYLFDRSLDDFITMGEGLRIRTDDVEEEQAEDRVLKRERAAASEVSVDDEPLLRAALAHVGRSPSN